MRRHNRMNWMVAGSCCCCCCNVRATIFKMCACVWKKWNLKRLPKIKWYYVSVRRKRQIERERAKKRITFTHSPFCSVCGAGQKETEREGEEEEEINDDNNEKSSKWCVRIFLFAPYTTSVLFIFIFRRRRRLAFLFVLTKHIFKLAEEEKCLMNISSAFDICVMCVRARKWRLFSHSLLSIALVRTLREKKLGTKRCEQNGMWCKRRRRRSFFFVKRGDSVRGNMKTKCNSYTELWSFCASFAHGRGGGVRTDRNDMCACFLWVFRFSF